MNRQKDDYTISTDKSKLDISYIHQYLSRDSYWAAGVPVEVVKRSIEGSICFGVYHLNSQIGFARLITDCATFAYLADVFIDPGYRGKGLSKWLMETIMAHEDIQGLRRIMLATRDAHGLYAQYGFLPLSFPDRWMHIHWPDRYQE